MTDVDDDEDLVGTPPPKRGPGRPRTTTRPDVLDQLIAKTRMGRGSTGPMVEDMLAGVTVSWLSQVFNMDPKTVKQRLADCPPLHNRKAGYVYSLPVACRYLIPPATSAEQYIKTMKPSDLPTAFQAGFWDAALKRQKWEENAGELWRTSKVREVLGQTFQTIKFTLQLWPDTLERQTGLTREQKALLILMVDALQEDIFKALVTQAAAQNTPPQSGELKDMLGEPPVVAAVEDEDDYSHLI